MTIGKKLLVLLAPMAMVVGCQSNGGVESTSENQSAESVSAGEEASEESSGERGSRAMPDDPVEPDVGEGLEVATFAGGCFWCMEKPFEKREGVREVVSGFCGGKERDPTYKDVATGKTEHTETVQIRYEPDEISYEELLDIYWRQIDPTDAGGQFVDRGSQYRPAIFYHGETQKKLAEKSKEELADNGPFDEPIVVEIVPASEFWKANDYHQDFYKTHEKRYKSYRRGSGRNEFLEKHWGNE